MYYHEGEIDELFDDHTPLEDGRLRFWSNPDVPDIERLGDTGRLEFDCPYPNCGEDFLFELMVDKDDFEEAISELLNGNEGTFRCAECNEPIYAIRGGGGE